MRNKLKHTRKAEKLTLNELSTRSGVSKSYLCDLEKQNGAGPSLQIAYRLAAVFDCYVYDIWPDDIEVDEEVKTIKVRAIRKKNE